MSGARFCVGDLTPEERYAMAFRLLKHSCDLRGEGCLMALLKSYLLSSHSDTIFNGIFPVDLELDTFAFEFDVMSGRADIAIFHADGTATALEVKDGTAGRRSVLTGIGQVGMYALEMGLSSGRLKKIRKALLWSSLGSVDEDAKVSILCDQAGVCAMPEPSLAVSTSIRDESFRRFGYGS